MSARRDINRFPLSFLFEVLKQRGYPVEIKDIIQIESLILSDNKQFGKLKVHQLKDIIPPFVAKNAYEQQQIALIIEEFVDEQLQEDMQEGAILKPTIDRSGATLPPRFKWVMLIFFLAFAALLLFKPSTKQVNTLEKTVSTPNKELPSLEEKKDSQTTFKHSIPESRKIKPVRYDPSSFSINYAKKIVPEEKNNMLYTLIILGTIVAVLLHFFVFYTHKKKGFMEEQTGETTFEEQLNHVNVNQYKEGLRSLSLDDVAPTLTHPLYSTSNDYSPLKLPSISKAFKALNYRIHMNDAHARHIDFKESIRSTIQHAGFPILSYARRKPVNKCIVCIDWHQRHTLLSGVVMMLLEKAKQRILIEWKYINYQTLEVVEEGYTQKQSLSVFLDAHKYVHLILVTQPIHFAGSSLAVPGIPWQKILERFALIEKKSLLYSGADFMPVVFEKKLESLGFQFGRLELDEFIALLGGQKSRVQHMTDHTLYDHSPIEVIENYFQNPALFQVFCALSLHTTVNWHLTWRLFIRIMSHHGYFQTSNHNTEYALLLKLCRLSVLQQAVLPDDLRTAMMRKISKQNEILAREVVIQSLQQILARNSSTFHFSTEIEVNVIIQKAMLHLLDPELFKAYKHDASIFMQKLSAMGLDMERKHAERLLQLDLSLNSEQKPRIALLKNTMVFKVTLARAALLILPYLLFYAIFTRFRPAFLYPETMAASYPIQLRLKPKLMNSQANLHLYHGDTLKFMDWAPGDTTTLILDEKKDAVIHLGIETASEEVRTVITCGYEEIDVLF